MDTFKCASYDDRKLNIKRNELFSQWKMNEDIVISGISGVFPDCQNIDEFMKNLYEKIDMVSDGGGRWPVGYLGLPRKAGNVPNIDRFDAQFFGFTADEASFIDLQLKILIELVFEAIWDAGVDPDSLKGTNTGFFLGSCYDDMHLALAKDIHTKKVYAQCYASQVSHLFDLRGPSLLVDVACASSLLALHQAIISLRTGECNAAIVAGININVRPHTALGFHRMKMTSNDCACRVWDQHANGYARSEAAVAVFLQRRSHAKRLYASVLHTKSNTDGYKVEGITFPKYETQRDLLVQTYSEAGIDPKHVQWVEAHATGTKAGDPVEAKAMADAMCVTRDGPLLVGAVKSNIGHTEGASGLCALAKVIIAYENKCIPPNIHYNKPNPEIDSIINGQLKVVTENTPFDGGLVGLNNWGFGGSNVHAIVINNDIEFNDTSFIISENNFPRLIQMCGATKHMVNGIFDFIKTHPHKVTKEFLALINELSKTSSKKMTFRGFMILNSEKQEIKRNVLKVKQQKPIWFVFAGMGSQWSSMGKALMNIDLIANSLKNSAQFLLDETGFDLMHFLLNADDGSMVNSLKGSIVSITAIQLVLIDFLSFLGIKPDGFVGHSIGEFACGYADACLTAKETLLIAYNVSKCIEEAALEPCMMAAVGLNWSQVKESCPPGVWPACKNSLNSVTISGSQQAVKQFTTQLKQQNIFVHDVNSCQVAFHSPLMQKISSSVINSLEQLNISHKLRSKRWISSSVPESDWTKEECIYSCARYYVNNLVSPVLFDDALNKIPKDCIIIEVSPHSLLQASIKSKFGDTVEYIPLMKRSDSNINLLLSSVGCLYTNGYNPCIENLYPKVDFPVPRGVPFISPLIKWDHSVSWFDPYFDEYYFSGGKITTNFVIDLNDDQWSFLSGHRIDGKILFPATGYLYLTWKMAANFEHKSLEEISIELTDVVLNRATILSKQNDTIFYLNYLKNTGSFSIVESGNICASGRLKVSCNDEAIIKYNELIRKNDYRCSDIRLSTKDIYKELRIRGYNYGPTFQGLVEACDNGNKGVIKWSGNWISFVDSMLQISMLGNKARTLFIPTRLQVLRCDARAFYQAIEESKISNDSCLPVVYDKETKIIVAPGVEIKGVQVNIIPKASKLKDPKLESYIFIAHNEDSALDQVDRRDMHQYLCACKSLANKVLQKLADNESTLTQDLDNNELINKYITSSDDRYIIIRIFKELVCGPNDINDDNYIFIRDNILSKYKICNDILLTPFKFERFLIPHVNTIIENNPSFNLNVVELSTSLSLVSLQMNSLVDRFTFGANINYTIIHPHHKQVEQEIGEFHNIKCTDWTSNNFINAVNNNNTDVVIINDPMTHFNNNVYNFADIIITCKKTLRVGAFLLILLKEENLGFETLFSCTARNEDNVKEIISLAKDNDFILVSKRSDSLSITSLLLRKCNPIQSQSLTTINIDSFNYEWVQQLRKVLKENQSDKIWLTANNEYSGIIGLMKCLRKEPYRDRVRCLFIADHSIDDELKGRNLLMSVMETDLVTNVYKDGVWGNWNHLTLTDCHLIEAKHAYLNVQTRGNLSSFKWFEPQHKLWPHVKNSKETLIDVYYAPINFRDIMMATGRLVTGLSSDTVINETNIEDSMLGLEFSGLDQYGERVMGIVSGQGLATSVISKDEDFLWPVPNHWSLEEASTIPVCYATAYYALIIRGKLRKKESVLIHAGSGGVGQAAINICLYYDCEIFTSVGSQKKVDLLLKTFPKLKEENILNSRSISFETKILQTTEGRGVDLILNSLSEEKLQASVRCLKANGRFLEIGKYDFENNTKLELSLLTHNKTFDGILLDLLFMQHSNADSISAKSNRLKIRNLMIEGIKSGAVRPLNRFIFEKERVEEAFRFMATGKHMGKVVLKIRDETQPQITVLAEPRAVFYDHKSYIIVGGLGGVGLQLATWMAQRGAKIIIFTSRNGIKEQYQELIIKRLHEMSVYVNVLTLNIAFYDEAKSLIKYANRFGPVGGIFNLGMVLSDALMENQTLEKWKQCCDAKVNGTQNLDLISREACPQLDHFVAFSSIACGRGNGGQSNYGFANSVMERICEKRRSDGLPAVAIQWGTIGDAGYVAESLGDVNIGGTEPQRISSCLQVMDILLNSPYSITSSYVKEENQKKKLISKESPLESVMHIMGIKNSDKLSPQTTLGDLGMDSLMSFEIKQVLERDYETVMSVQQIRHLTVDQLKNLSDLNSLKQVEEYNEVKQQMDNLLVLPTESYFYLNEHQGENAIFFVPPIDAGINLLKIIAKELKRPVISLNWTQEFNSLSSVEEVSKEWIKVIKSIKKEGDYILVGYSFGALIAFQMALDLQSNDDSVGHLILLDGSPTQINNYAKLAYDNSNNNNISDINTSHVEALLAFLMQFNSINYSKVKEMLIKVTSMNERNILAANFLKDSFNLNSIDINQIVSAFEAFFNKLKLMYFYDTKTKFEGHATLIRASEQSIINNEKYELEADYGLGQCCTRKCTVIELEGDHKTFITNNLEKITSVIMKI